MSWLNYHHLHYFWMVAREGSIAAACEHLHVAQPTVSAQIRKLETCLGQRLFERDGRRLRLTEAGVVVYRFADEIFTIGRELMDSLRGHMAGGALRLHVGVADVVPKLVAHRLLAPALKLPEPVRIICFEAKPSELLARLAVHELDVVLADSPASPEFGVRAYNHLLGECSVTWFGTPDQAAPRRRNFPRSLDGAPVLLPAADTALRRSLEHWFDAEGIHPAVVGEFADSALLKVFGQQGAGLFPCATAIESYVRRQYNVRVVGRAEPVREQFFAISMGRRVKHPGVLAITRAARETLFAEKSRS